MNQATNIFRYREEGSQGRDRIVGVIFIPTCRPAAEMFCDGLASLYDLGAPPDIVTFVVPTLRLEPLLELISSSEVKSRFRASSDIHAIRILVLCPTGEPSGVSFNLETGRKVALKEKFILDARNICLTQWFRYRGGMMEPGPGYYYRKPSRKAVNRFIRTGNILVDSEEIDFLAYWIVSAIRPEIDLIWVDSSTILSVAYALLDACHKWLGLDISRIKLRSSESYRNYWDLLEYDGKSLVLISASSGGAMARDFFEKLHYPEGKIVTLFYLPVVGERKSAKRFGNIVCDLEVTPKNTDGYEPAILSEVDQNLFPPSDRPIYIAPEGFLPEGVKVETVTIGKRDIPIWYRDLAPNILGRHVAAANCVDECQALTGGMPRWLTLGFDLGPLWTNAANEEHEVELHKRLIRYLRTRVPSTVTLLVHAGDPQSAALTAAIEAWLLQNGVKKLKCISVSEFATSPAKYSVAANQSSFTLIIGSCLIDLHPLLNASQLLRDTQKNHALGYIVGMQIGKDKAKVSLDKSNLKFCNDGSEYDVDVLATCYSNWLDMDISPWQFEIQFWEGLADAKQLALSIRERRSIAARISELLEPKGLVDNVFLEGPCGQVYSMRANSAFVEGIAHQLPVSQADSLFVLSCVLSSISEKRHLGASPLHRIVMDPENFSRYSDGVFQAALLR